MISAAQKERLAWLQELRTETPCADCGKNYPPCVMEFDHVKEKRSKKQGMAAFACGKGWERLREEVAKCEIVCANCHKIRTFARGQHRGRTSWYEAQGHAMESAGRTSLGEQV